LTPDKGKGIPLNTNVKWQGRALGLLVAAMGLVALGTAAQMGGGQMAPPMQKPSVVQTTPAHLSVTGVVTQELQLTGADLKALPRTSVTVVDPHDKKSHVYAGVTVEELLKRAGVPTGENLHGKSLALCVVAGAADGYHAVFSIGELDPGIGPGEVLVASDGQPLPAGMGPLRLIVPSDKRPARSVHMVQTLTVVSLADAK
jgi:DMSO/TMAO reductase YedYZ molybdopterin-dependent catalytic subunit